MLKGSYLTNKEENSGVSFFPTYSDIQTNIPLEELLL